MRTVRVQQLMTGPTRDQLTQRIAIESLTYFVLF